MRSKILIIGLITAGAILMFSQSALANGGFYETQKKQRKRIMAGLKQGKITRQEYAKLIQEQRRIQMARRRALSDGKLTYKERNRLMRMLENASRHIYWSKHNKFYNHKKYHHPKIANGHLHHHQFDDSYTRRKYDPIPRYRLPYHDGFSSFDKAFCDRS